MGNSIVQLKSYKGETTVSDSCMTAGYKAGKSLFVIMEGGVMYLSSFVWECAGETVKCFVDLKSIAINIVWDGVVVVW